MNNSDNSLFEVEIYHDALRHTIIVYCGCIHCPEGVRGDGATLQEAGNNFLKDSLTHTYPQ